MANLISKVYIGGVNYEIKDADSRTKLSTLLGTHAVQLLGTAAWLDADASVTAAAAGVPTTGAVKDYVDAQIGAIHKFDVVVADELPTASADTMYKLYLIPHTHEETTDTKDEYITVRSGSEGSYTYSWEKIGSTDVDLSGYVQKTQTIAGLDLQNNISTDALQNALGLEDLAYVDSATGTVPSQTISGVKASGSAEGSVTINELTQTSTVATISSKADYTPEGSVSGTVSVPNAAELAVATAEETGHTITGTVSKPDVNLTSTSQAVLTGVKSAGSAATWTGAAYTAPSLGSASSASFAQKILKPVVTDSTETLSFSWVNDDTGAGESGAFANAVTAQGTFSAGNVDFGTFNGGSVPTFNDGSVNNVTAAELSAAPTFTGEKVKIGLTKADASITASFSGTTSAQLIPSEIKYDKATANGGSFTGSTVSFDVGDIVVKEQNVQVTPKAS